MPSILHRLFGGTSGRRSSAAGYVAALMREPDEADVEWLTAHGSFGDADHATWELRYARRALGLLVAQRDALDDRTASDVARAIAHALGRDPHIAAGRLKVAERQINARLRSYSDALANRDGAGAGWHLGRALLRFAGRKESAPPELVTAASEILARYMDDANEELRRHFGSVVLPPDVAPSAMR